MWYRKDLKEHAKARLNIHYWKVVLVSLILSFVSGSGSGGGSSASYNNAVSSKSGNSVYSTFTSRDWAFLLGILATVFVVLIVIACFSAALSIFVFNPLTVGAQKYLISCQGDNPSYKDLSYAFSNSYWNVVKTMFLMKLFTFLWSLLFIIPGIIKGYEYRMIPYILAENPAMDSKEVFARTKAMMTGEKWATFVLDLSFIGWSLLGVITCCILSILYVNPYYYLTNTELYLVLKQKVDGAGAVFNNPTSGQDNPYVQSL